MSNPILYIDNALRRAEDGNGDGTCYASAASAAPDPANMRFTLPAPTIIADLNGGADTDDLFNGMLLYFPASTNRYHVTDWVAGTNQATTAEPPQLYDTGACEFRRELYAPDMDPAFPIHRAVDGSPSLKAKVRAVNVALTLDVALPNLIGQGGFEERSAGVFPSTEQPAGNWWSPSSDWGVVASSAMRGSRCGAWSIASADADLYETLTDRLIAGKTYRILLQVTSLGGSSGVGGLRVRLTNIRSGSSLMTDWDLPAITTTATWHSVDFIPTVTTDKAGMTIRGVYANRGAASEIRIDEVYTWEVVPVASLLAFGHNWDGVGNLVVRGYRCAPDRTNAGSGEYVDLSAAAAVVGTGPVRRTWTVADPPTADQAFPIYRVLIPAHASFQYEVGELMLAMKHEMSSAPLLPFDPYATEVEVDRVTTAGGQHHETVRFSRRIFKPSFEALNAADQAMIRDRYLPLAVIGRHQFAIQWAEQGIVDPVLVTEGKKTGGLSRASGILPDLDCEWQEVL